MTIKTDKNFIYDYLIHLDSFLLHGVSEVGAPTRAPQIKEPISQPYTSAEELYQNKSSPVAFVVASETKQTIKNVFNSDEEHLFQKIVGSMGLSPTEIYVTIVDPSTHEAKTNEKIKEELSKINCRYIVCLGKDLAAFFTTTPIEAYHVAEVWQTKEMFQKNINLVVIPSLEEMLLDARHKKAAWAQLKKVAAQINDSI
jgi:hypothetical protein